jgi:hypothetical protein
LIRGFTPYYYFGLIWYQMHPDGRESCYQLSFFFAKFSSEGFRTDSLAMAKTS